MRIDGDVQYEEDWFLCKSCRPRRTSYEEGSSLGQEVPIFSRRRTEPLTRVSFLLPSSLEKMRTSSVGCRVENCTARRLLRDSQYWKEMSINQNEKENDYESNKTFPKLLHCDNFVDYLLHLTDLSIPYHTTHDGSFGTDLQHIKNGCVVMNELNSCLGKAFPKKLYCSERLGRTGRWRRRNKGGFPFCCFCEGRHVLGGWLAGVMANPTNHFLQSTDTDTTFFKIFLGGWLNIRVDRSVRLFVCFLKHEPTRMSPCTTWIKDLYLRFILNQKYHDVW